MKIPAQRYRGNLEDFLIFGDDCYLNFSGKQTHFLAMKLYQPPLADIRQKLVDFRERGKWSQAYVAALLGVPKVTLRKWEMGERNPSGAARKLIWLLHALCFRSATIHNDRDIASWGGRFGKLDIEGAQPALNALTASSKEGGCQAL